MHIIHTTTPKSQASNDYFSSFTTKQHLMAQGDSRPAATEEGVTDSNFRKFIIKAAFGRSSYSNADKKFSLLFPS
jgi:hypothetical protein